MDWNTVKPLLEAKLDKAHVRPPAKFGPKGDYLEGWHVIAEANRIFGFGAWSYDVAECRCVAELPREIGQYKKPGFGVTYIARVVAQVGDVRRDDVGAGHGYDVDLGLAHESAVKEAVTDALKRALRTFGNPFGLALYDKSRANVGAPETPHDPVTGEVRDERNPPPVRPDPEPEIDGDVSGATLQAWMDGITDNLPKTADKDMKAKAFWSQFIDDLDKYKSERWLTAYVESRRPILNRWQAHYPDLFESATLAVARAHARILGEDLSDFEPVGVKQEPTYYGDRQVG